MKKVFLSLAVIATLTVVSCKDKAATEATETTEEMAAPVEDTTATAVEAASPATEAPAATPAE